MLELRLLGAFEAVLAEQSGTSLLAQPKRAALVVYLALGPRTGLVRRDRLLALFWPDADEAHARRALNQALHYLRGVLGADVLVTRGDDEVGLDHTRFHCDVLRVRELLAHDRLEEALALYRGELLPGFHAHASNDFDDWLERERLALGETVRTAASSLSNRAHADGNTAAALHWARRAVDLDPFDEGCAQQLIRILMQDGNEAAAHLEFDRFAERIGSELDIAPAPMTTALLEHSTVPALLPPEQPVATRVAAVPRARRRLLVTSIIVASVAAVSVAGARLSARSRIVSRPGGARPTILIADLTGPPSDTALGGIVTQLLLSGLEDSRTARAVWSGELGAALGRMRLPPSTAVRGRVARELAVREGYGAVLDGGVRDAGTTLLINVSLVEPETGHVLFSDATSAAGVAALTKTVDALVRTARKRIGDSKEAIARAKPLEQVTTSSLEAWRAYTEASRIGRFETSRQRALLERAVAIDSNFAAAYRKLGMITAWQSQPELASELLAKAMRHSSHASEHERASIEAMLYSHGRYYDAGRALTAWETLLGQDSTDGGALLNAAWLLGVERQFDAAERAHARALAMGDSMGQTTFMSLARDRFVLGKTAEAWRTLDAGIRRNPRSLILTFRARAYIVAGQLDSAETDLRRALESTVPADASEDRWLVAMLRATMARQAGQIARARAYDADGARYAREAGHTAREFMANLARAHDATRLLSRPRLALAELSTLRHRVDGFRGVDRPIPALAQTYAEAGDPKTAAMLLRGYERGIASGEWRETEPERHFAWAQIALAERRPLDAVDEMRAADVGVCVTCTLPLLSLAYERAGQLDSAIAVGERYFAITDPSASDDDGSQRPVLHRRLGELYARRGDLVRAERHLNAFMTMWRNADAELQPQVSAARRQLALLKQKVVAVR